MIKQPDFYSNSPSKGTRGSQSPKLSSSTSTRRGQSESKIMRVIRNREQAELLFMNELKSAKAEVLIASSSLSYLNRLNHLGLLDFLEQTKSRGVEVLIMCPEVQSNSEKKKKIEVAHSFSNDQLLEDLKKYAHVRSISGQIKGSIVLTDNTRVLAISEEGIDAFAIFSDNKSLVNNFGSLFETLWIQKEVLTDLVLSKDALLSSNEKLKRHDLMQKEFINIAAHELRTPVQPLLVIAEHIRKDLGDNESVTISKKRVEILVRSIKRLERLTSDILDVSRIESKSLVLSREVFDLGKKVEEAIADVHTLVSAPHAAITFVPSKLSVVHVNADASKISQVIMNLLRNALKFTPNKDEGGAIQLVIDVNVKDNQVLVEIRDNGPGIDLFIMPRLFTKFSTRSQQGGTGLGLYIAKAIVEAHGGRIWGENNKDGKGATFGFALPLADDSLHALQGNS